MDQSWWAKLLRFVPCPFHNRGKNINFNMFNLFLFLIGKIPQLRTNFRWKGCPNFLNEDGGIPPKFLHLGDFSKFSGSIWDPSIPPPQQPGRTLLEQTMVSKLASKPFKSIGLLYFRVSVCVMT